MYYGTEHTSENLKIKKKRYKISYEIITFIIMAAWQQRRGTAQGMYIYYMNYAFTYYVCNTCTIFYIVRILCVKCQDTLREYSNRNKQSKISSEINK
jgi:hypothetical protein